MAERELGIVIRAKDLASKTIAGINRQLGNIGSNVSRGLANATRNVERGIAAVGAAAVGGLAYSLKVAGDFEAQMNTINTLLHATPAGLGAIGDSVRKLARDTGTPLADLTTAYYDLVSAGIKQADAQSVLESANRLAIGGLGSTADGVNLLTTALNVYGGGAKEAADYADYFAQSVAAGVVKIPEIAASFAQVGPLAQAMGIDIRELAAGYGQLTSKGETGASAATAMSAALVALQRKTGAMEKAQETLNVDFAAMADEKGLAYTYQQLVKYAKEYNVPLIDLVGRQEALAYAYDVSGDNAASYARQLDAVTEATEGEGVAAEQMAERQKGLNFQIDRLKALATDAAITIGERLLPKVVPLFEKVNQFIQDNQAGISQFADKLAAGFDKLMEFGKKLPWGAIGDAFRLMGSASKMLLDAFLGMPGWVQTAVVTSWGLNKLTGGMLGNILGGLSIGLGKWLAQKFGLMTVQAGVVNVAGKVVSAPGGPPGPGGDKGPGKVSPWDTLLRYAAGAGMVGSSQVQGPEQMNDATQLAWAQAIAKIEADRVREGRPTLLEAGILTPEQQALVERLLNEGVEIKLPTATPPARSGSRSGGAMDLAAQTRTYQAEDRRPTAVLPDTAMAPVTSLLATAERTLTNNLPAIRSKADQQLAKQHEVLSAMRAQGIAMNTLAAKNFSPVINVGVSTVVHSNVSVHEWQRTVQSSQRAYSDLSGGI